MCRLKKWKGIFCISTICFFKVAVGHCQDPELPKDLYIASSIPDSLKDNANSVVRFSNVIMTVGAPGRLNIKTHEITTILNEKADHEAILRLDYQRKFNKFSSIEMRVFDANGVLIKKYRKSDMYDGAANDDETVVSDDRFLAVRHTIVSYPVTIEKEFEEDLTSFLDLRGWNFQSDEQSVQNAYCRVLIDHNAGFRYLNKNTNIKPTVTSVDGKDNFIWQVINLKAIKIEEGAEDWRVFPHIYFAADKFEFYGVPGDFSSWKSFGIWIKSLNADVNSLSPEREAEIKKMTDSIKTEKEKARFLYKYMQQNMRYVSIQLGIGGLKPFPATFVDQKKYGDCKALSNYMGALLKAVGIPSYYAVINAEENREPADPSFPYNYFNHVIRCIPFKNDTTWLECTSNNTAFGELGPFTENRKALIIKEDGCELVNTPKSTADKNQFNSEAHIILDPNGGAKTNIKITGTGEYREIYIGLSAKKMDEQKELLLRDLEIKPPSYFDYSSGKDENNVKQINLNLEYEKFCDIKAGDKQFYKPMAFKLWGETIPVLEKRKSDYYFDFPRKKSSITTIDLPVGFEVETLPVDQSLKFTYGSYEVKYVYDAAKNQVISTAKFNLTNHVIPADKYTEMQQYLDAVAKAQNKKLVIRRKV